MGIKAQRAAPYSTTDEQETLAITTFRTLIDHAKVKFDIKERDKHPNIDGYLELVDEFRAPIGKLEVQIRKLPDNQPKMQCPISLFSYIETACNPVLLVGVDTIQKKAYWVHVKRALIAESVDGSEQKTKVITFPTTNLLDGKDAKYIGEWRNIVEAYQTSIREYPDLKESFVKLSRRANSALGVEKEDFGNLHVFLDELNAMLDGDFSIVKKIFYPDAWKIGLAYSRYEDSNISYTLYPIPFGKNDVQIKEMDATLSRELQGEGLGFAGDYVENPIRVRPREYAIDVIEYKTSAVLENRLLNHNCSEFLAREFLFAFIDRFSQQLGLDPRDKYVLHDIERAFFQYLPVWTDEAMKFMLGVQRNAVRSYADLLYGKPFYDPGSLIPQIMRDERKQIEQVVRERMKQNSPTPAIPLGNDKFPFGIFAEFFSFLKSMGLEEVSRPYSPRDFSRLKERGGWIWNLFSPEAVEKNLRVFFENLPSSYNRLVLQNFPELLDELPLFGDASLVVVFFNVQEEIRTSQDAPIIDFFYLKSENQRDLDIKIYRKGEPTELPKLSYEHLGKDIEIDGKKHRLISMSTGILDFIYDDLPVFNFLYKILQENLKGYFNDLRKQKT